MPQPTLLQVCEYAVDERALEDREVGGQLRYLRLRCALRRKAQRVGDTDTATARVKKTHVVLLLLLFGFVLFCSVAGAGLHAPTSGLYQVDN